MKLADVKMDPLNLFFRADEMRNIDRKKIKRTCESNGGIVMSEILFPFEKAL